MPQPSITNAIHKLEDELGVKLLKRNTKKVSLTFKGEIFNNRVIEILRNLNQAVTEVRDLNKGPVKLGLPPMIGALLFPNIFLEFNRSFPHIELQVIEKGSLVIQRLLDEGKLDLAFMILPHSLETLHTLPLIKERMMVCLPHSHHLSCR